MALSHTQEEQLLHTIRLLAAKRMRIAAAEIGTGGTFAQTLSAAPGGAARVFRCGLVLFDTDGMTRLAESGPPSAANSAPIPENPPSPSRWR